MVIRQKNTQVTDAAERLGTSTQEVERKWIVRELPDLTGATGKEIVQGYIAVGADGTEVRIRQKGDRFFQTIKSEGGLVRDEIEVELTKEQFDCLWQATAGRRLQKTRYEITCADVTIELDVYKGELEGLILAEVEFESVTESEKFSAPEWFGAEVTEDSRYKNKNLT
jgi:CYTH domain-containing protein